MVRLLVVDLSSVPNGYDNDRILIFVEDHTPVANPQANTIATLEAFYVAMSGRGELCQTPINPTTNVG